jgi:hypothetical protein
MQRCEPGARAATARQRGRSAAHRIRVLAGIPAYSSICIGAVPML